MKKWRRPSWKTVIGVAIATFLLVVIGLNFVGSEKHVLATPTHLYGVRDPAFERVVGSLLGPPIVRGNRVDTLVNGDEIFPAMLEAIRSAEHTIDFETYIYWKGETGRTFARTIAERAKAGVRAHVLLDWVGSQSMDEDALSLMRDAGAQVEIYHPLRWYTLARLNNRTHRKLLVVDGRVGFTGGVGIADEWTGHAQDPSHWRDTHFRVEGPVVAQMQAAFEDNWIKVTGEVHHEPRYFPAIEPREPGVGAQMFLSSPAGGSENMEIMYLLAIAAAERSILLEAAYFIPDDRTVEALLQARRRGVRVDVIVPGPVNDAKITRYASRNQWGMLLSAGVSIHEYQPTMFHCKVLVVDGYFTSVGSTNFDERSFRLNDEASLNVFDTTFAARQAELFEQDLARSRTYSLQDWQSRSMKERVYESIASWVSSQL
ncbi:phospholipase D-like domain-containing protein [Dokdonella fugitiva]|jgi:cardiolipin synthase|uniref:Cardiolipin synthase n=1 Tax=Dokdonella fugitiva TaxID=328517 RepID=A0A4R2I9F7_9GAMM|nr:phospholipase D-like domain-containing protein [Dokdonella fugitiva]TCO40767.1 cardiolipin synthase [Dokdonella fugitiva]